MKISAISFDLTGTLLRPFPSLGALCVQAMREQKIAEIPSEEIFNFRQADARSRAQINGHAPVSEERSKDYWRAILWEIFAGACDNSQFKIAEKFIYNALAQPEHWRLMPFVRETLEMLQFLRVPVVVISNGDSRWKKALADKQLTPFFRKIFISAETGISKPNPAVFDHVCRSLKIARNELLHIGDSLNEDIVPAANFGANAFWVTEHPTLVEKLPERVEYFPNLQNVGLRIRDLLAAGTPEMSRERSVLQLLSRLENRQLDDDGNARFYGNALDPQKEIAVSAKFIAHSEESRERGDFSVQSAANLVPKIIQKRGFFAGSIQEAIGEMWPTAAGTLANRCRPDDLKNNFSELYVRCENAAVMSEFSLRKAEILRNLKKNPACKNLKKLIPIC